MKPAEIKSIRETMQMTQQEFAAALGLQTRSAVSLLESGAREPKGPLLMLLRLMGKITKIPK